MNERKHAGAVVPVVTPVTGAGDLDEAGMKKHQRYFPVEKDNKLVPYFITVCNHRKDVDQTGMELILEGNEHVIRARFADADFFVRDDLKQPLAAFLPRLGTLAFQVKLGSMLDKTNRIVALTHRLAEQIGLDDAQMAVAGRAAELCKADLATKMVVEMTALQGIIGRYYALRSGESEAVADAKYEHYLPRFTGDDLPQGLAGLVVGLADRLDTLVGLFAAGPAPTGAKDPFALRRAALGLVQLLVACDLAFDLRPALGAVAGLLPLAASPESQAACLEFIVERLRNMQLEAGQRYDVVDAVVAAQGYNPARAARAIRELGAWVERAMMTAAVVTIAGTTTGAATTTTVTTSVATTARATSRRRAATWCIGCRPTAVS